MTEFPEPYRYWTARCKTPECCVLILGKIGPVEPYRIPFLSECRDFKVTCSECMKEYTYTRNDVAWENAPVSPASAVDNAAFVAATKPLERPAKTTMDEKQ